MRAAVAYVRATPSLRIPLLMMVAIGTVSFNFQVLLPLLASETWEGTAATYATLTAVMGVGSVLGALAAGARGRVTPALLVGSAALFGIAELLAAVAPTLTLQALALVPLGAASVTFAAGVNSSLQLAARADAARARDGALRDRLPRLDRDRGAGDRLARPGRRPAQRALRGRRGGAPGRVVGLARVAGHSAGRYARWTTPFAYVSLAARDSLAGGASGGNSRVPAPRVSG